MSRWSCLVAVLLVVADVGCGGKKPLPGADCVLDSDCYGEFVCIYERCHVMCKEAKDCKQLGQLCAGPLDAGVCLLPEEQTCGSTCKGELFCAIDLTCRTQCTSASECPTPTQKCVPSASDVNVTVCAEPDDLEDDALKPAPDAGVAPDAAGASDAGDASGLDAGADGVVGPVPDGGQSGDAGDVIESEPNEDWQHATTYTPGTTVLGWTGSAEDIDFYEMVVPAGDPAGGYFQASITEVGEGRVKAIVYTASDNRIIHQASAPNNGGWLFFYWAGARDQKYRIEINRAGSFAAPYKYTFKIQYTKVNDAFEPNDTSAGGALPLVRLGTPITAYFFTGFKEMTINPDDYQDWFVVELPAGMITVRLDHSLSTWRPMFDMIDATGNMFTDAHKIALSTGASFEYSFLVMTPGLYRAVVKGYGNESIDEADNAMTVPDNFTKPYTLTISQ